MSALWMVFKVLKQLCLYSYIHAIFKLYDNYFLHNHRHGSQACTYWVLADKGEAVSKVIFTKVLTNPTIFPSNPACIAIFLRLCGKQRRNRRLALACFSERPADRQWLLLTFHVSGMEMCLCRQRLKGKVSMKKSWLLLKCSEGKLKLTTSINPRTEVIESRDNSWPTSGFRSIRTPSFLRNDPTPRTPLGR